VADRQAYRLIEHAEGQSKLFWSRWHSRAGASSRDKAPKVVLDAVGSSVTDPTAALKVWREYVVRLSQDHDIDGDHAEVPNVKEHVYNQAFARKIKADLQRSLSSAGTLPELSRPIVWEEIHAAVRLLVPGSAAGPDELPADLLRLAGMSFVLALAQLFNEI
jgi:hypothetical protein